MKEWLIRKEIKDNWNKDYEKEKKKSEIKKKNVRRKKERTGKKKQQKKTKNWSVSLVDWLVVWSYGMSTINGLFNAKFLFFSNNYDFVS